MAGQPEHGMLGLSLKGRPPTMIATPPTSTPAASQPAPAEQSAKLLGHYTGYLATWTIELGLRHGLLALLASRPEGASAESLAAELGLDPLYTQVWSRSAYAAGLLELADDGAYRLGPHFGTLLLNSDAPGYLGGLARVFTALRETFLDLRTFLPSGQREWWSDMSPEWIAAVGDTGQVFYRRMLDLVIPKLPAVEAVLRDGGQVLDLACGVLHGPIKIAQTYPAARFTAVDGDPYTLELARQNLAAERLTDRFELLASPLEQLDLPAVHDLAIINISLHEARDPARVVAAARQALRPGGTFLVSEFPFPDRLEACRTLPAQIMCGIQYFEAHIGCQLLSTARFVELLESAGFDDVGVIEVTPVHVVIHGTA
jgi:SAM-dependent methyltransferase